MSIYLSICPSIYLKAYEISFTFDYLEFAKLRTSGSFAPYVPSCLRALRSLRAFVPYVPSRLCALRAFVSYSPSRFTCLTHAPYLRALCTLFVHVKIALGWICSPTKTYIFQELLKALLTVLFLSGSNNSRETF